MNFNYVIVNQVKHPILHVLASILAWQSSVINPIIYALTNRQYRQAYLDLFNCTKAKSSLSNQPTSRSSGKTIFTEMVQIATKTNLESSNNVKSNGVAAAIIPTKNVKENGEK